MLKTTSDIAARLENDSEKERFSVSNVEIENDNEDARSERKRCRMRMRMRTDAKTSYFIASFFPIPQPHPLQRMKKRREKSEREVQSREGAKRWKKIQA